MAKVSNQCKDLYKNENYAKAFLNCEKACNLNNRDGGYHLGLLYQHGQSVRQDFTTPKQHYGKACDLDYQCGCDAY